MTREERNPFLLPEPIGGVKPHPSLPLALAALLTHPAHRFDLRGLSEIREALELVREELRAAGELPPAAPPLLPDPPAFVRTLLAEPIGGAGEDVSTRTSPGVRG